MIAVELSKKEMRKLARLSTRFPRETYRGIGRAGATGKARLKKVMRVGGGVHGVPTFAPLDSDTEELSERKGDSNYKIGGKLAEGYAIQMYKNGKGAFTIGFLSAFEPYARPFQEDEVRPLVQGELFYFRYSELESTIYARPARPVIAPFADQLGPDLLRWALRNTEKILEKNAAK